LRRIFIGIAAGCVSGILLLLLAYLVGVIAIFVSLREVMPTMLAAVTYFPLMLILVGTLPTAIMAFLIGMALAVGPQGTGRRIVLLGALHGVIAGEVVLALGLRLLFRSSSGDFVSIAADPILAGAYGLILGVVASLIFRKVIR